MNAPGAVLSTVPVDAPRTVDLGGGVKLVPSSKTLSGYELANRYLMQRNERLEKRRSD